MALPARPAPSQRLAAIDLVFEDFGFKSCGWEKLARRADLSIEFKSCCHRTNCESQSRRSNEGEERARRLIRKVGVCEAVERAGHPCQNPPHPRRPSRFGRSESKRSPAETGQFMERRDRTGKKGWRTDPSQGRLCDPCRHNDRYSERFLCGPAPTAG